LKAIIEATVVDGQISPTHAVEIYCPNCGRDVDEAELGAQKCNDCGFDLSEPKQSVAIHVTSMPAAGGQTM
jgi:predicted RNA-binding Zn-ribbon protein involved in translation (DUF1610 family)